MWRRRRIARVVFSAGVERVATIGASPRGEVFTELKARWPWRPMPNCPGRFVFSSGLTNLPPAALVPRDVHVSEHVVATARDPVAVAMFVDGGLISYRKPNGTYLHTLSSREGFDRKLQQLGLDRGLMRSSTHA